MNAPGVHKTPNTSQRWLRPQVLIPGMIIVLLLFTLFSSGGGDTTDSRLTTFSNNRWGVQGTYDVLSRLGFPIRRNIQYLPDTLSEKPIYVFLEPRLGLSEAEIKILKRAVSAGAGLLLATRDDSLAKEFGFSLELSSNFEIRAHEIQTPYDDVSWRVDPRVKSRSLSLPGDFTLRWLRHVFHADSLDADTVFLWYNEDAIERSTPSDHQASPVMAGRKLGKGHVVLLSVPALLQNQIARGNPPIIAMSDALHWMNGLHRPILVDEYHQGFGVHANIPKAINQALRDTPLGRTVLQIAFAAILLLFALSLRPIVPSASAPIHRRSLLEHVDALAHAYTQNARRSKDRYATLGTLGRDARTMGIERLITGLRRRHPLGIPRNAAHLTYFSTVRTYFPNVADDATLVQDAITTAQPITDVTQAVARIEAAILNRKG